MINFRKQLFVFLGLLAFTGNAAADNNLWLGVKAGAL
jgi:hypothetical protein